MERSIVRGMCFTRFLIERDCLTAAMTRLGSGFIPPSAILDAKHHLAKVQELVREMEAISTPSPGQKPLR